MIFNDDLFNIEITEHYESQQNGNISEFKKWLKKLNEHELYYLIKFLQAENLKL
jgi:hypothetical protein